MFRSLRIAMTQSTDHNNNVFKSNIQKFLSDFTTEVTPLSAAKINKFNTILREETKIYVTFLPGSDYEDTLRTSKRLREEGFIPVPHIAARSLPSKFFLEESLKYLKNEVDVDELLLIGGAVEQPIGCFESSMQVMETGLLDKYDIRKIGVAGHPEGSPDIPDAEITSALKWKNAFSERTEAELYIITQFCFDAKSIIEWDQSIQHEGNKLPVRIGLPGIASIKTLLNYAIACGVGPSIKFLKRQSKNVSKLMMTNAPDKQIVALAEYWTANPTCGLIGVHMYPLGGIKKSSDWMYAAIDGNFSMNRNNNGFLVNC